VNAWWEELFSSEGWQRVQLGWPELEEEAEQADRIERALTLEPGASVLDVPCGTGRIAVELAARGYRMSGIDLVDRFLEEGRARAAARGIEVDLRSGDMREPPLGDERFDGALCFWGSFGYFDEAGNAAQARAACSALRPGGRYLLDVATVETVAAHFRPRHWFTSGGVTVTVENAFATGTSRIETDWTFHRAGQDDQTRHTSVRLYTLHELTDLLRDAGFAAFEARDDALDPFELGAERLWLVATKAL
jgi:cyclopropane fatty-acyl-phospholipid synthase-like methyltransferase